MPADYLAALGDPVPAEVLAECGVLTAGALAFAAMRQRLLLRQLAGLQPGAAASVLKVVHAWNQTSLRRAVLGWHGAGAAALGGPPGKAAQGYLSLPPTLLGGGTLEIQLNVIGEQVLGLPR